MKKILSLAIAAFPIFTYSQPKPVIVPQPVNLQLLEGTFLIDSNTTIHAPASLLKEAGMFADYVNQYYHVPIAVIEVQTGTRNRPLTRQSILLADPAHTQQPAFYQLRVTPEGSTVTGDSTGIFYGLQTLQQLIPSGIKPGQPIRVPAVDISDFPRFGYRGMHLDVSRHMFPVRDIKRYIDFLAWHKFNVFHWHLTDDQGWRIEIRKRPELTKTGSCRNQTLKGRYGSDQYDGTPYCGYYSQDEIRDIVQYASDRHITVIPEIDMPGHSKAALTTYPYLGCTKGPYQVMETWGVAEDVLCAGNDSTLSFVQDVLTEVMNLFPSKMIHIGGDECPKTRWKNCPVCQARIKALNLKDEHELQSDFIRRVESFVNSRGRTIIGWDEILEGGLAPNAIVMSWRGEKGGIAAAKQQHPVIMTPENPLYLNHAQSKLEDSITQGGYNPIENVYRYEPIPAELDSIQGKYILGAQGNMWSEYINNTSKLEYMLFPRISALSEVLWSPRALRNWDAFEQNLPAVLDRYHLWRVNYSTAYYDLQPSVIPGKKSPVWKLDSRWPGGKIRYTTDSASRKLLSYNGPVPILHSGTYGATITNPSGDLKTRWIWQSFQLNLATGKKIKLVQEPNKSYSLGGAFALVDGIQNTLGMIRSSQFLGFNGKDMEAIIDLGKQTYVRDILVHAFEQPGSWIYRPSELTLAISRNGKSYQSIIKQWELTGTKNLMYRLPVEVKTRFIRIKGINPGIIREGLPGAGHSAWIFFDEIEVR